MEGWRQGGVVHLQVSLQLTGNGRRSRTGEPAWRTTPEACPAGSRIPAFALSRWVPGLLPRADRLGLRPGLRRARRCPPGLLHPRAHVSLALHPLRIVVAAVLSRSDRDARLYRRLSFRSGHLRALAPSGGRAAACAFPDRAHLVIDRLLFSLSVPSETGPVSTAGGRWRLSFSPFPTICS